ncbi:MULTISPECIES: hypothetical protein [Lichenihabitans]|nr:MULTISPECIES: hypothetical protein [Lichenihabitans]
MRPSAIQAGGAIPVLDIIFIAVALALFAVTGAYAAFCDRL